MSQSYPLNQSPFYQLTSRQKLAKILWTSLPVLEKIANSGSQGYKEFDKIVGRKRRHIECPKRQLYEIASSLNRLLGRIEVPDYVHSGVRGRSYLSNARSHLPNVRMAKIDIKKFFPSASYKFVFQCFITSFRCSPDVAAVLTKLSTIKGHIPTGSPSSTIISFYAYKPMFDEIDKLARECGLTMSLCVDDMTFSGARASEKFLFQVYKVVKRNGLDVHKRHLYGPNETKVVTGVAVTSKGIRLPNKRRKKLHEALSDFYRAPDQDSKRKAARVALGRSGEAAHVEPATFKGLFDKIKPKAVNSIYGASGMAR